MKFTSIRTSQPKKQQFYAKSEWFYNEDRTWPEDYELLFNLMEVIFQSYWVSESDFSGKKFTL